MIDINKIYTKIIQDSVKSSLVNNKNISLDITQLKKKLERIKNNLVYLISLENKHEKQFIFDRLSANPSLPHSSEFIQKLKENKSMSNSAFNRLWTFQPNNNNYIYNSNSEIEPIIWNTIFNISNEEHLLMLSLDDYVPDLGEVGNTFKTVKKVYTFLRNVFMDIIRKKILLITLRDKINEALNLPNQELRFVLVELFKDENIQIPWAGKKKRSIKKKRRSIKKKKSTSKKLSKQKKKMYK